MSRPTRVGGLLGLLVLSVALWLGLTIPVAAQPTSPTIDEVGVTVICMCGCGAVLNNCVHQDDDYRRRVEAELKQYGEGL